MTPRRRTDEEIEAEEYEEAIRATAQAEQDALTGQTAPPRGPVIAQTYINAVHPDTGVDVVFIPGEAIPTWAVPAALEAARAALAG
ncbi:hypothetical protein [Microbacterium sp. CJ88]|uniref:hypothetical protein n=1 Tax=Microbacterium sp. CJ88 TaxID=3445672 RepID=UPI003F65746F